MKKDEVATSSHDSKRPQAFDNTCFGNEGINNFAKSPTVQALLDEDSRRSPGPHRGAALAARGPGELAACPLLDTLLPKVSCENTFRFIKTRSQRTVYTRLNWGLVLPGRYYFLTVTNTGFGKLQFRYFLKLKWWLKRQRAGIAGAYVCTDEGGGVIHLVLRLGMRQKRLDKKEIDAYLASIGCGFCDIRRVKTSEKSKKGLSDYLADQNRKKRMAGEMAYQAHILRWNYIGRWLPKHWISDFKRAWVRTMGMSHHDRMRLFRSWLVRYADDPDTWKPHKPLTWDNDIGWRDMEPFDFEDIARINDEV